MTGKVALQRQNLALQIFSLPVKMMTNFMEIKTELTPSQMKRK